VDAAKRWPPPARGHDCAHLFGSTMRSLGRRPTVAGCRMWRRGGPVRKVQLGPDAIAVVTPLGPQVAAKLPNHVQPQPSELEWRVGNLRAMARCTGIDRLDRFATISSILVAAMSEAHPRAETPLPISTIPITPTMTAISANLLACIQWENWLTVAAVPSGLIA